MRRLLFLFAFLISAPLKAAMWPDSPWLNRLPQTNAVASGIAFVSPYDLQFFRIMNAWRRLEKRYGDFQVNFIIVAMGEQSLPMTDEVVRSILREYNYLLPVLLDQQSEFAKASKAYVSPTVNLITRDEHVTNFDAGNFDPAQFEKALQKILKENHVPNLQNRDFSNDGEVKACGHMHTFFLGERFGKAWAPDLLNFQGPWVFRPYWAEGPDTKTGEAELNPLKSDLGILAESKERTQTKLVTSLDGSKIPTELRGRDVQEDKTGNTYINVGPLKMYQVINHGGKLRDGGQKFTFTADSKNLKLRAVETSPSCLEIE